MGYSAYLDKSSASVSCKDKGPQSFLALLRSALPSCSIASSFLIISFALSFVLSLAFAVGICSRLTAAGRVGLMSMPAAVEPISQAGGAN